MSAQRCRASLLTCVGDSQPINLRCIRAHTQGAPTNIVRYFRATVLRTMTVRYHPLALSVAHQLGDSQRAAQFLAQLIGHWAEQEDDR